jgi:hypothetical protein
VRFCLLKKAPRRSPEGQNRKYHSFHVISALPHKADLDRRDRYVRFVPKTGLMHCDKPNRLLRRHGRAMAAMTRLATVDQLCAKR